jgi:hypothetical protein
MNILKSIEDKDKYYLIGMVTMSKKEIKQYHKYLNEDELQEIMSLKNTNFYEVYK